MSDVAVDTVVELTDDEVFANGLMMFKVMDNTGDTKSIWDPEKEEEIAAAKAQFDLLKKKGYMAYRVKKDGKQGEAMHKFDPDAGSMILVFVPAIQAG